MSPRKSRYITLCQQLLTLLAVGAVVAPAANIVSMNVTHAPEAALAPAAPGAVTQQVAGAAQAVEPAAGAEDEAPVATAPVASTVEETTLTDAQGVAESGTTTDLAAPDAQPGTTPELPGTTPDETATTTPEATPGTTETLDPTTELLSEPQDVTGFGAVGVTWSPGATIDADTITFSIRTATDGTWSDWEEMPFEQGSDEEVATSGEEADVRPGTELVFVGEVDQAQVQVTAPGGLPSDVRVAVVDPGEAEVTEEAPAYEPAAPAEQASVSSSAGDLALASSGSPAQPAIYSRAQWGADERLRTDAPRYAAVKGAVIHHTVNANDYTADQVPSIIRGIYAYHVKSQGWSDVGYNFLVDKFGRLWEGRYGGITRAVRGAHISAYNDYAFGISAIGNYETAQPTAAMQEAIAQLIAWKLSIHGIAANSTQTWGSVRMPAIIGHRDGGQTACPGKYLYAKLGAIRSRALQLQNQGVATPQNTATKPNITDSNLVGSAHPDVLFRHNDGNVFIQPTGGMSLYEGPLVPIDGDFTGALAATLSPDLTGDGRPDVVVVDRNGVAWMKPGQGGSKFGHVKASISSTMFKGLDTLVAAGDVNGDGKNDLVGRVRATGKTYLYTGMGNGKFGAALLANDLKYYPQITVLQDVTGDRKPDLVLKDPGGRLFILPLTGVRAGKVTVSARITVPGSYGWAQAIGPAGDITGDGKPDLLLRRNDGKAVVLPWRANGAFGSVRGAVASIGTMGNLASAGNLVGASSPDVFGTINGRAYLLRHTGGVDVTAPVATNLRLPDATDIFNVGDWDGDGKGDVVSRGRDGVATLWRGNGAGRFTAAPLGDTLRGVTGLRYVGDVTGDGKGDFFGTGVDGRLRVYPGLGSEGFGDSLTATQALADWFTKPKNVNTSGFDIVSPVASLTGQAGPDLLLRKKSTGEMFIVQRTANGTLVRFCTLAQMSGRLDKIG